MLKKTHTITYSSVSHCPAGAANENSERGFRRSSVKQLVSVAIIVNSKHLTRVKMA